jgi:hypothetical protein
MVTNGSLDWKVMSAFCVRSKFSKSFYNCRWGLLIRVVVE